MVGAFKRSLAGLLLYLREARREMQKVNWPTRQEVVRMTLIVVALSVVVAAVLGGFDFIFDRVMLYIIAQPAAPVVPSP